MLEPLAGAVIGLFRDLPFGKYLVREIAPPEGNIPNDTVLPVEITEDGEVLELVIKNTLFRGGVRGYKVGSETNTSLSGALIGLFHGDEPSLHRTRQFSSLSF